MPSSEKRGVAVFHLPTASYSVIVAGYMEHSEFSLKPGDLALARAQKRAKPQTGTDGKKRGDQMDD